MAKKSPLSGYNHNLKYKGRVYHVQTEDSGLENPHIFTHLFHDGTILAMKKREYKELLSNADWEALVREQMQSLHKDMMKGLVKGEHDERIVQFFGSIVVDVEEELPMATLQPPPRRGSSSAPAAADEPEAPEPLSIPTGEGVVIAMPMVIIADGYQATAQPAAPQTSFKPDESRPVPDSIFGSDLISEKSLDEVILAYLSEDMTDD